MLAEARLLRQHKTRLEARMKILEEHNRQLETQLSRLRQLLDEVNQVHLNEASAISYIYFYFAAGWKCLVACENGDSANPVSHSCPPRNGYPSKKQRYRT